MAINTKVTPSGASQSRIALQLRLGLAALALLTVCWQASSAPFTVNMVSGNRFSPANLTVQVGDTVTWVNQDFTGHDTVSGTNGRPSGVWNSGGLLSHLQTYSFTFNVPPGGYGYYCTPHVFVGMVGSITVVAASNTPPSVTITNPPDGSTFPAGSSILLQALASDPDGTVSNVSFFANGSLLGADATAPYNLTLSNAAPGSYSLRAVAADNLGATATSAVVNITVQASNLPPSVTITNPADGTIFFAGANVLIQADASDPDSLITQVEFFTNGVSAGIATSQPFSLVLSNVSLGDYSLSAVATDNHGATAPSAPIGISVIPPPLPPAILVPPQSQTVTVGSSVFFSVSADGTPPLYYQWQVNGANLPGATTRALALINVQSNNAGAYGVIVSNVAGSITSPPAVLTVFSLPRFPPVVTITNPPNGAAFASGANVPVAADASESNGVIAYVEFFLGSNSVAVVTNAPYRILLTNLSVGDYSVSARAVDDQGLSSVSPLVTFSIQTPPALNSQPQSRTNLAGTTASLSVSAGGTPPLAYQWKLNGTGVMGATNSALAIPNVQTNNAGSYTVVVTNAVGSVTSQPALLFVNLLPQVAITNPADGTRFPVHANVPIVAEAFDPGGAITQVQFFVRTNSEPRQLIGLSTTAPFGVVLTNLSVGASFLSALATDNLGGATLSEEIAITAYDPPSVLLTTSATNSSLQLGTDILLTASATSPGATVTNIALFDGSALLASSPADSIAYLWRTTEAREHSLTAVATDDLGQTGVSASVQIQIFAPQPFSALAATYSGVFFGSNASDIKLASSGFFTLQLTKRGTFSGKLAMSGANTPFRGQFDAFGKITLPVVRRSRAPVVLAMQLDRSGDTGQITGTASTADGTTPLTAGLLAERNVFNSRTNPAPQAGRKGFVLQLAPDTQGQSVALIQVRITPGGQVKFHGDLNDGQKFNFASTLSKAGAAPFYVSLSRGAEALVGWFQFGNGIYGGGGFQPSQLWQISSTPGETSTPLQVGPGGQ